MKVKIFSMRFDEKEKEINEWLESQKGKIQILDQKVRSSSSTGNHYLTIVFFFKER